MTDRKTEQTITLLLR